MTADELETLIIENKDPGALQRAMAPMTEAERAKLSTAAQKIFTQLSKSKANATASDRLKRLIAKRGKDSWKYWRADENRRAILALFGLGPISALKNRDVYIPHEERAVLSQIIRDRRPEWLDDWIEHELDQQFSYLDFTTLRGWIKDGLCRKPAVDGYYRMYAWFLMRTKDYGDAVPPISAQLLADPELLEDVEGLFRVENIAFNTNSWLSKGSSADWETWPDALVKMAAGGHIERAKLMQLALEGLTRDLKQNQLSGFHSLYKRMSPSTDELVGHQRQFIDLLCHPVGHVVKFAIEMLAEIEKKGALDTGPVVSEIQVVLAGGAKGNAAAALKLMKRIIARTKGGDPSVLLAVCEALRHSNVEVQAAALDILEANRKVLGGEHLSAIAAAGSFVTASNRGRLAGLAEASPRQSGPQPANENPVAESARPASAQAYQPIPDDINRQKVLSADDALQPIASVDELIDTCFHAVEVVDSPDEVERIIDGISRFGGDRPSDFTARVAPLLHRLKDGRTTTNGMFIGHGGVGMAVSDLLMTWLSGKRHRTADRGFSHYSYEDGFQPLIKHLNSVTERLARGLPAQLLSTPTHRGGWVDPLIWVERLISRSQEAELCRSPDFLLSLLRLAPDQRDAALGCAAALDSRIGRIARFALGGKEMPTATDRNDWAAWLTAARCRAPLKDWTAEFAPLKLHDQLPDGLRPAQYEWRAFYETKHYRQQSWEAPEFTMSVGCQGWPVADNGSDGLLDRLRHGIGGQVTTDWRLIPTAALNHRSKRKSFFWGETSVPWVSHWLSYVWPQNPSAALMKSATKLTDRMDENSSGWSPAHGHFQALFQKNRPWLEPGHLLLAIGLAGKDADARGLAIDALIEGIDGRRFDPLMFASVMARLSKDEWIKHNRIGDALAQVITVSELHAAIVGDALQNWLPRLDLGQRNSFRILEVLVEAQAAAGRPLSERARASLQSVKGSGKAAKLAKQLLRA